VTLLHIVVEGTVSLFGQLLGATSGSA
jgi:hypothetical protein